MALFRNSKACSAPVLPTGKLELLCPGRCRRAAGRVRLSGAIDAVADPHREFRAAVVRLCCYARGGGVSVGCFAGRDTAKAARLRRPRSHQVSILPLCSNTGGRGRGGFAATIQ